MPIELFILVRVVARLAPFKVIAGVVSVPVKVGEAFGAFSSNKDISSVYHHGSAPHHCRLDFVRLGRPRVGRLGITAV